MKNTIRVLVIDDSMVSREIIDRGLSSDPQIKVVSKAVDAFDAADKINAFKPDIITCDIQMPKMDGIEFIKRILPQYPVPIIVVSSVSNIVFEAMKAGAVDFVGKPNLNSRNDVKEFINELITKIKESAEAKVIKSEKKVVKKVIGDCIKTDMGVIAIGASTGGTEAISSVLNNLPSDIPGIVIVQHIPPLFSRMFAERLNKQTAFNVKEAVSGDVVTKGVVLIAPGDQHMSIIYKNNKYMTVLSKGNRINGHCPSVDVLFESVSKVYGKKAVGVILTGMGYDGAKGLLSIRRRGGKTLGQDEASSVVYGMPKVAFELGAVMKQSKLSELSYNICEMLKK